MKKILLVLAVVAISGMVTSCTDEHADESEFSTVSSGIGGEDRQNPDEDTRP
jgi:hypothetical protein